MLQRMVMRRASLYLLLVHFLVVGAGSECVPFECLRCNATAETQADPCGLCSNNQTQCIDVPSSSSNCKKDFQVSVKSNGSAINEGDDLTLTCDHNLSDFNLTFEWKKDGEKIPEENENELHLKNELSGGDYICCVNSPCGIYESSPHSVTVNSSPVVILVICGVSALVLVVVMGLAMKFKLKRDHAKHKERMKEKARMEQNSAPVPFTPRES